MSALPDGHPLVSGFLPWGAIFVRAGVPIIVSLVRRVLDFGRDFRLEQGWFNGTAFDVSFRWSTALFA
jgi:hypothetical protein